LSHVVRGHAGHHEPFLTLSAAIVSLILGMHAHDGGVRHRRLTLRLLMKLGSQPMALICSSLTTPCSMIRRRFASLRSPVRLAGANPMRTDTSAPSIIAYIVPFIFVSTAALSKVRRAAAWQP
jgi:hypothetical protein